MPPALAAVLARPGPEDQLALRPEGLFARRLRRADATAPRGWTWRPRGTVLITGGHGGLGQHVARWLAAAGAGHLVLASRRGGGTGPLPDLGVPVTSVACDVADRAALARLLDQLPGLTAVFHAAGSNAIVPVADTDPATFAEVIRAKVTGAANLDELLGDRPLDAFVLFSSIAGTWGSGGQSAYAAANAYLDGLAGRRRARGLAATSVAWGPWAGPGMLAADGQAGQRLRDQGLLAMAPARAVAELQRALDRDETAVVIADVDWARFAPLFSSARPRPLLSEVAEAQPEAAGPPAEAGGRTEPGRQLADLPGAERDRKLAELVSATIAAVLGHQSPQAIEPGRALADLGFDSLTALELRTRLSEATGLALPATLVFDHPTPEALTSYLGGLVAGPAAARPGPASAVTGPSAEPVAIVAMSCRFPGGLNTPEQLWQFIEAGGDAVGPFPADRGWDVGRLYDPDPGQPGKTYVRHGGFLYDAAEFDPGFFGISPREALAMDPQQRLLLETAWEAFERAGIEPGSLRGSRTGVFVGAGAQGYLATSLAQAPPEVEGHLLTGNATSVVSGRLAYTFGLEGPALTVDTACSSALVALHLAVRALRNGECELALACGATVMATPDAFIGFSRQRGLAPDGRCKPFSASADGTGWGEGVGLLLVERLADARRRGHPVLAIVRGTAVNADGASNGLTAPNGAAQQRVIGQALADAGLAPSDVDTVEAHGTGTVLGDPIEAQALIAAYGPGRDRPLAVGSVKSNLGHTQAASGAASAIKMVMAMRHGLIPRTLHVTRPSEHVDWSSGALALVTENQPWPREHGPRRAGVSAFGVSGTNAHVILEQPQQDQEQEQADTERTAGSRPGPMTSLPWVLSARSAEALAGQARRLLPAADAVPAAADPVDTAFSLLGRSVFAHRAVVLAGQPGGFRPGLAALAAGRPAAGLVTGRATPPGKVAFLFPGQGAQWAGMALSLLDDFPAFARRMRECAAALAPYTDWALLDVLADASALERAEVVQPALFAVMVSLAALWQEHGVSPDAVAGHSQGEIAAACVAGALTLDEAARVVTARSQALAAIRGRGGMVSVPLPAAEVAELFPALSVAAVNGPRSTVVAGDDAALAELLDRHPRARRVPVDYASHSAQVEAIRDQLLARLPATTARLDGAVPFYSTVAEGPARMDPEYWYQNLRQPVRFESAVRALLADGCRFFVEVSPHTVLGGGVRETIDAAGADAVVLGTLRRGEGGRERMLASLAEAFVQGVPVDWRPAVPGGRLVALPTYAFQRERFWLAAGPAGFACPDDHPFGALVALADGDGTLLTGRLSVRSHPWLADHRVLGDVVLPGTAWLEMALSAGAEAGCPRVQELTFEAPLVIPGHDAAEVQVSVGPAGRDGTRPLSIHARAEGAAQWTRHASGAVSPDRAGSPGRAGPIRPAPIRPAPIRPTAVRRTSPPTVPRWTSTASTRRWPKPGWTTGRPSADCGRSSGPVTG